jgi:hypothetical protein
MLSNICRRSREHLSKIFRRSKWKQSGYETVACNALEDDEEREEYEGGGRRGKEKREKKKKDKDKG